MFVCSLSPHNPAHSWRALGLILILAIMLPACQSFTPRDIASETNEPQPATTTPQNLDNLYPKFSFALPSDPDLIRQVRHPNRFEGVPRSEIPDLISRMQAGFTMPNLNSGLVDRFIEQYSRQKPLERTLLRAQYFLADVLTELETRQMPTEIALLPIVESSFNTKAVSSASAVGVWQFISSTGTRFGLRQSPWLDERQYTPKASRAALDYLQLLYGQFGDWSLALAAYNCGEGCVQGALKKSGWPKNRNITYDELSIPLETKQYAPRLQALKEIFTEPEKYRIKLPHLPNTNPIRAVSIDVPIRAQLIAQLADISLDEVLYLNAHLKQDIFHPAIGADILLPEDSVEIFLSNLPRYHELGEQWLLHQVKNPGDLSAVAKLYQTNLSTLKTVNPEHLRAIKPRDLIIVPLDETSPRYQMHLASVHPLPTISLNKPQKIAQKKGAQQRIAFKSRNQSSAGKTQMVKKKQALREKYVLPKPLSAKDMKKKPKTNTKVTTKVTTKANTKAPTQPPAKPAGKSLAPVRESKPSNLAKSAPAKPSAPKAKHSPAVSGKTQHKP